MEQPTTKFCFDCDKETTHYWKEPPEGKRWKPFWGCINYKNHTRSMKIPPRDPEHATEPRIDGQVLLLEEMQSGFKQINERLDSMAEYLSKKEIGKVNLKEMK